jgi:hypothetical protein
VAGPRARGARRLDLNSTTESLVIRQVTIRKDWMRAAVATAAVLAVAAVVVAVAQGGDGGPVPPVHPGAFDWLRPRGIPSSWSALRVPGSPARLPLPGGWKQAHGDAGTRTAELENSSGDIVGYLNATPKEGKETLANWPRFRPAHNRDERDREVRLLASARGLPFQGGAGSCVLDSYLTATGTRYKEIACIVAGSSASTVIVAAAPPRRWAVETPVLERAVAGFET